MKLYVLHLFAILGFAHCLCTEAHAVGTNIPASSLDIFEVTEDGRDFTCADIDGTVYAGKLRSDLFSPYKGLAARARRAARAASGDRKSTLLARAAQFRAHASTGDAACAGGTPAPDANFDGSGNLTEKGKTAFGVPSTLTGNISEGQALYNGTCEGCHSSEETNRSFTTLRSELSGDPMYFTSNDIPDSDLADLVAYLNRYRFYD